jgi:D-arabinose 1-dehydrogenase-like Zn-dependent alcohol dehydrogenase
MITATEGHPGRPKFPFLPGYDVVGAVGELGAGVDAALLIP